LTYSACHKFGKFEFSTLVHGKVVTYKSCEKNVAEGLARKKV